jgi:hypothetical protein
VENESPSKTTSLCSGDAQAPKTENGQPQYEVLRFHPGDPENPYNWGNLKKTGIIIIVIVNVFNSTLGSALAANIAPYISKEWNIHNENLFILPTSIYLVGYIIGPLLWG